MCYSYVIKLPNGFSICKRGLMYDLLGNDNSVIVNCNRFDYIYNKVVALERYEKIHVFSLKLIEINGKITMKEIATFKSYLGDTKLYFTYEDYEYCVTRDCKICMKKKV